MMLLDSPLITNTMKIDKQLLKLLAGLLIAAYIIGHLQDQYSL
jgi:hypothetical protein